MTHRLTFPAPSRCWSESREGWSSHPWTELEVRDYITAGGWFAPGKHDFDSQKTAKVAYTSLLEAAGGL